MEKRMQRGKKKYGNKYLKANIIDELEDELVDVANYAYMLWCKVKKLKMKI